MLNTVTLIGYTGRDPETKYTPSGTAVANFPLAMSEKWTDKKTGEKKENTEWMKIVCFGKTAELVSEYVKKGQPVCVIGKIRTRKWDDKEGVTRWTTEIVANRVVFLGGGTGKKDEHPAFTGPPETTDNDNIPNDDIPF